MSNEIDFKSLKKEADDATKPVPKADYAVENVKVTYKPNSSGNPMYVIEAKIMEGAYAGRSITSNFSLTVDKPAAMAFFFRHMRGMGLTDEFWETKRTPESVAEALLRRRSIWSLDIGEYLGNPRNVVSDVKVLTGPLASPTLSVSGATSNGANSIAPPTPEMSPAPTPNSGNSSSNVPPPPVPFD